MPRTADVPFCCEREKHSENNEKLNVRSFLEDAEKKLIALKELYQQELINYELYIKKTNQIAEIVSKVTKEDIFEFGKIKNRQVIDDLRFEILDKMKSNSHKGVENIDFDSTLKSIDEKIKKKEIRNNI